jgi:hypothetical protein
MSPQKFDHDSCVIGYVFYDPENHILKVGHTTNLEARFYQVKNKNRAFNLKIIHTIKIPCHSYNEGVTGRQFENEVRYHFNKFLNYKAGAEKNEWYKGSVLAKVILLMEKYIPTYCNSGYSLNPDEMRKIKKGHHWHPDVMRAYWMTREQSDMERGYQDGLALSVA